MGLSSTKASNKLNLEVILSTPEADDAFFCESRSINRTFLEAADKEAAKFKAVVVLPTPPF